MSILREEYSNYKEEMGCLVLMLKSAILPLKSIPSVPNDAVSNIKI